MSFSFHDVWGKREYPFSIFLVLNMNRCALYGSLLSILPSTDFDSREVLFHTSLAMFTHPSRHYQRYRLTSRESKVLPDLTHNANVVDQGHVGRCMSKLFNLTDQKDLRQVLNVWFDIFDVHH